MTPPRICGTQIRPSLKGRVGLPKYRLAPREAFGRPELRGIVIRLERGNAIGQSHPRQFRARVDMHIGRECGRLIERAHAHEAQLLAPAIIAPERGLAFGTAMDDVRTPAIGRHRNADGLALHHHAIGLDQRIEHEGRARLPLTILAMTAMHEHRRTREPILHRTAGTGAGESNLHKTIP